MTNDERQLELYRSIDDKQQKISYYIIGLSVAAIGFSISQTSSDSLHWTHTFLGGAIISWAYSIRSGLKYSEKTIVILKENITYLKGGPRVNPTLNLQASKSYERLRNAFYVGIMCFLVWHIVRMNHNRSESEIRDTEKVTRTNR
jgi:hypothetical protein